MVSLSLKTLDGGTKTIDAEDLESLRGGVRGTVCLPGEAGYDAARAIWNAMIDRRPGLVVCCAGAADVMRAVRFARANGLLVAVRGGGHNIAGNAICDGGLMIDLSPMRSVRVDPTARKAWVGPGATLGDLDKETQAFGLAVPTGINSTTGVAGLTLGGGFGWITRKFGLTIDTLLSADVVTADGELVRASEKANSDLFWALRGGGGNFGIVTGFEFQLHPVGPQVLAGLIVHPFADAPDLLRAYRRIVADAPDELTCWVVMRKAPPLPFLNEEWHGREVLVFALLLRRRPGKRRKGRCSAARARQADRRRRGSAAVYRLAVGLRPAADARGAQLLEEPRLCRAERSGYRGDLRVCRPPTWTGVRDLHRPDRWCDEPSRRGRDGVPPA
jgi:FAD/FMN-containing dehydrogenase